MVEKPRISPFAYRVALAFCVLSVVAGMALIAAAATGWAVF